MNQVSIYKAQVSLRVGLPGALRGEGGIKFHITFHPQRRRREEGGSKLLAIYCCSVVRRRECVFVCGAAAAN